MYAFMCLGVYVYMYVYIYIYIYIIYVSIYISHLYDNKSFISIIMPMCIYLLPAALARHGRPPIESNVHRFNVVQITDPYIIV